MQQATSAHAAQEIQALESLKRIVFRFAGTGLVLCAIAGIWAWRTTASVTREIAVSVEALTTGMRQVASAAGQVAGSAQSLSQGSTQQAASLEETSASMEEMASMTRRNADNCQEAAFSMGETERLVSDANKALGEMVISMVAIKDSSDKVSKIIKTIDESSRFACWPEGSPQDGWPKTSSPSRAPAVRSVLAVEKVSKPYVRASSRDCDRVGRSSSFPARST